jgi:hypothetical protein
MIMIMRHLEKLPGYFPELENKGAEMRMGPAGAPWMRFPVEKHPHPKQRRSGKEASAGRLPALVGILRAAAHPGGNDDRGNGSGNTASRNVALRTGPISNGRLLSSTGLAFDNSPRVKRIE